MRAFLLICGLLTFGTGVAQAGVIDLSTVLGLLNGKGVMDDFETFDVPNGTSVDLATPTLDSATVALGQGPDLVHGGCTYSGLSAPLCWMGDEFNGYPMTKTLIAWYEAPPAEPESPQIFRGIVLTYDPPRQVVGLDIYRFLDLLYIEVLVFGPEGSFVDDVYVEVVDAGSPTFFGYRYEPGITKLVIKNTQFPNPAGPNINNHLYGDIDVTAVKPSTWGGIKALYR